MSLRYEVYDDKRLLVYDDNKQHAAALKSLGASFARRLKNNKPAGYLLPIDKEDDIIELSREEVIPQPVKQPPRKRASRAKPIQPSRQIEKEVVSNNLEEKDYPKEEDIQPVKNKGVNNAKSRKEQTKYHRARSPPRRKDSSSEEDSSDESSPEVPLKYKNSKKLKYYKSLARKTHSPEDSESSSSAEDTDNYPSPKLSRKQRNDALLEKLSSIEKRLKNLERK